MSVGDGRSNDGGGRFAPRLEEALSSLRAGFPEAEVYAKWGRSRRLELATGRRGASDHREAGWAVRAGTDRASLFTCGSGELPADPARGVEADGLPLALPGPDAVPSPGPPWQEPAELDTGLVGETEGLRLLDAVERELADELPRARLLSAWLEDGCSDSRLANSHGVAARWRLRLAVLRAEAALGGHRVSLELAEREARRFHPASVARRLADLLVAAAGEADGSFTGRDRAEVVLAPALASRLLAALAPLFVGPQAARLAGDLAAQPAGSSSGPSTGPAKGGRRKRLAGAAFTLVDDGRLEGGVLAVPYDGEGLATHRVVLVEEGAYRQPLVSWRDLEERERERGGGRRGGADAGRGARPTGCSRRASWRDLPATAPSHLYLEPDPAVRAGELVADLARGYYLLAATAPPRVDWGSGAFRVPVLGYSVREGRAAGPLSGVTLTGPVVSLLGGVRHAARDLTFFPYDGMIGSPTLRVSGLELRA